MTIVFDTLHFSAGSGGPARVTSELIGAFQNLGETVRTIGPENPEPAPLKLFLSLLWRIGGSPDRSSKGEKLIQIAGEIWPVAASSSTNIIIIHDTFALEHPEWAKAVERLFQKRRVGWAEKHADLVVTPSEEMKTRLLRLSPGLENRLTVIPWGVSPVFRDAISRKANDEPYWVASGDETPRKGLRDLLAWYRSCERPPRLMLTGSLSSTPLPEGVNSTGRLALNDLARLIAGATAYLSFSHDEGFGLAIAEAAATGTPVVARSFPGGKNRFPDGIHWFDSPSEAGEALRQALARPRVPPAWTRELTWDRSATQLRGAILQVQ